MPRILDIIKVKRSKKDMKKADPKPNEIGSQVARNVFLEELSEEERKQFLENEKKFNQQKGN